MNRFAICTLAVVLPLALACSRETKGPGGPPPAAPVHVALAASRAVPVELRAIGSVRASQTVAVRSRVGGVLERVGFREGDEVRRGQLLFALDRAPLEAAVREAEARLARDRALADKAAADVERFTRLAADEFVTREQLDAARAQAASLHAGVQADQAALDNARLQLGYATISAPAAGRTGPLLVHAGNLVKANDDRALVVIQTIRPIEVAFSVPEEQLAAIRARHAEGALAVRALPRGEGGREANGTLVFVDSGVDAATGTIALKASFGNDDRALWPGQFVDVVLDLDVEQRAIVVPANAVVASQQGSLVYVVGEDETVEAREVTIARLIGEEAIIGAGIEPGERVVTDGQLRLVPGARVRVAGGAGAER